MARIPYPNPEDLPEESRAAAEKLPPLNIMKMFLNAPTKLAGIAARNVVPTLAPNIDTSGVIGRWLIRAPVRHIILGRLGQRRPQQGRVRVE